MISLFSYLLTFIDVIFWALRVVATLMAQMELSFPITPININTEIIILFVTIPCMLLVLKRNIIGAAVYFAMYGVYFGDALYKTFIENESAGLNVSNALDVFVAIFAIVISALTFIDVLINKNRNITLISGKKVNWFYNNKDFDRNYDERADRNQYKF